MMHLIKKKEFLDGDIHTNKYYFCGVRVLKKIWSNSFSKTYLFKFKISNHNYNTTTKFRKIISRKPIMIWFDHSLGGGTETYTVQQFKTLTRQYYILHVQYFHTAQKFKIYSPNSKSGSPYWTNTISELKNILSKIKISQIVVNNLVGYTDTLEILKLISELKRDKDMWVSYRGHDFQSICPNFNLMNCDGAYCNLKYNNGCEECWKRTKLGNNDCEHNILCSGATTIALWRKGFGDFFANTCDEMIVFSEIIKDIFIRVYPVLQNKTTVIPHVVKQFPVVNVPKHDGINIACLGNINHNKGASIIREICELLKSQKYTDVKLFVIGDLCDDNEKIPDNLHITGHYNPDDLPDIIQKNKIDIIFIPSICPETFSYTTSEAMSMGLPVACFNLGAPAERVSKYEKGLIIQETTPEKALSKIVIFVDKIKRNYNEY